MNLSGLETDGSRARQALQRLRVGEQRTVVADFGQQSWRDCFSRAGQRAKQCCIRMRCEQALNLRALIGKLFFKQL